MYTSDLELDALNPFLTFPMEAYVETKLVTHVTVHLCFEAEDLGKQELINLLTLTSPYTAVADGESINHFAAGATYSFSGKYVLPIDEALKPYVLGLMYHPLLEHAELELSLDFGEWSDFHKMEVSYDFAYQQFDAIVDFIVAAGVTFTVVVHPDAVASDEVDAGGEAEAEGVTVLEATPEVILVNGRPATEDQIRWLNTRLKDAGFRPKYLPDLKENGIEFVGDFVLRFYDLDELRLGGIRQQSQSKLIAMGLKRPATKRVHQVEGWVRPKG